VCGSGRVVDGEVHRPMTVPTERSGSRSARRCPSAP
jgi:hypothetical protein